MNSQPTPLAKSILIKTMFSRFVEHESEHCTLEEFEEWLHERNFDSLFNLLEVSRWNPDYVPKLVETSDGYKSNKRLDMVELGIAGHKKMTICKYKISGGYPIEIYTSIDTANFFNPTANLFSAGGALSGLHSLGGGWRWTTSLGKIGSWDSVDFQYVVNHAYKGTMVTLDSIESVVKYTGLDSDVIESSVPGYGNTSRIGPWLIFMVRLAR